MKCDNCRTELPNSKGETLKCPECGEEYEDSEEQESSPQTDNEHTFYPMMCHKCGTPQEQQSKEDWWHCSCGSYHKGFPYKCPIKQAREEMLKEIPCPQMSMESIFNCSCCWCKSLKETWLGEGKE